MTPTIETTLKNAERLEAIYRPLAAAMPRAPRGIWHTEMFFFFATVYSLAPGKIIESGRAQGQSTLLASHCFPDTPIVSIERDPRHPDAAIAQQRLADRKNVQCVFGDARAELPARTEPGDVVLIDGPKDFRALKLASRLMRENSPAAVFVHDCYQGFPVRRFLDRHAPWAFFADHPAFRAKYRDMDPDAPDRPAGLACLPLNPAFTTLAMRSRLVLARCTGNLAGAFDKRA